MKRIETIVSLPAFIDELFPQDIASMVALRRFAAVSFIEQNVLKGLAWSKPVYPAQRLGVASKRPSLFGNRSIFGVGGGATKCCYESHEYDNPDHRRRLWRAEVKAAAPKQEPKNCTDVASY